MSHENPDLVSNARSITEGFIKKCYPDETPFATLILDRLAKEYTVRLSPGSHSQQLPKLLDWGLPFDGEEIVKLVTPAAFLIISGTIEQLSLIKEVPPLTEIQQLLKDSARKAGASELLANGLAEVVGVELHARLHQLREASALSRSGRKVELPARNEPQYLVWLLREKDAIPNPPLESTWDSIQSKYLSETSKQKWQLLVVRGSIYLTHNQRQQLINLEHREYILLLMFLINKGFYLHPVWLHRKAWEKDREYSVYDVGDVMSRLKVPVSALRKKLKPIREFQIDKKERGYICTGRFSACVILSRSESEKLKNRGVA